jgi:hypothetical protein
MSSPLALPKSALSPFLSISYCKKAMRGTRKFYVKMCNETAKKAIFHVEICSFKRLNEKNMLRKKGLLGINLAF